MFRKILIPTDGSALSESAAAAGVALARGSGAEIVALSLAQPGVPPAGDTGGAHSVQAERERAMAVAARRAGWVAQLAEEAG